jgi:hypothetical protein
VTECGRLHLPVHIHSSAGAGDYFSVAGASVLNLEPVLRDPRYSATTFVLIHAGHPFEQAAMFMAAMKNVWLDSSATGSFVLSANEFKDVLRRWFGIFPDKVTYGSDAFPIDEQVGAEQLYWFGVHNARTATAAALAGNDCRSRDDREAGDGGRPWLPSRQRRGALQVTTAKGLRRVLTFRDLVLYYLVTGFSLRWIATASAAGPSALVIWVVAALGFFVPLVFTVLELSSRYPEEGGIYVWSKRAFGPFSAFMTGWTYWGSNLPYFPWAAVLCRGQRAVHRWSRLARVVHQQQLFHRGGDDRSRHRRDDERGRFERGEVVEQRRRDGELDSGRRAHRPRRCVVEPLRIGDSIEPSGVRAEHEPEGRHLLVHDRLRIRRRGKRVDDGRGDSGCAADRAARRAHRRAR